MLIVSIFLDYDAQVAEQNIAPRVDYKAQYNTLKKKLKFLLYVSTNEKTFHQQQSVILKTLLAGKRIFPRRTQIESTTASKSNS